MYVLCAKAHSGLSHRVFSHNRMFAHFFSDFFVQWEMQWELGVCVCNKTCTFAHPRTVKFVSGPIASVNVRNGWHTTTPHTRSVHSNFKCAFLLSFIGTTQFASNASLSSRIKCLWDANSIDGDTDCGNDGATATTTRKMFNYILNWCMHEPHLLPLPLLMCDVCGRASECGVPALCPVCFC